MTIEDEPEVRKLTECIEKEIKAGDAWYCTKCNSEGGSKENFINHMYNSHISPTNTCKNCHATLKNMHNLEPHKKGYSSGTLKCKISYSYEVKEKDLKEQLKEKHGNKSPSFMGIRFTMICRVIETEKNKLGPSWAKLSHN